MYNRWNVYPTMYMMWTLIELIWTITPALILILIAFPSFKLLYLMDEVTDPNLSITVEGHGGLKPYLWNKRANTCKGLTKGYIFTNSFKNLQCRTFHTKVKAVSRIGPELVEAKYTWLDGNFLTGFSDAEKNQQIPFFFYGCFILLISRDKN